jgi:hypothetical protein
MALGSPQADLGRRPRGDDSLRISLRAVERVLNSIRVEDRPVPVAPRVEVQWFPVRDAARRRRLAALLFGDRESAPVPTPTDREKS